MPTLSLRPWSEISKTIKALSPELHNALYPISKILGNNYMYEVELPLGTDLIINGEPVVFNKTFLNSCQFNGGKTKIDPDFFVKDFSNKNDHPLGLINEGVVEIYESNTYKVMEIRTSYNFPLNVLGKGELLGTFGATDLIHDSQLEKPHYTYSALCGNYCVFPLLPKDLDSGQAKYRDKIHEICKEYQLQVGNGEQLLSFFPQLLKNLYRQTDKTVKFILIPDFWYTDLSPENQGLRNLISKTAWSQSREVRLNDLRIIPIMKTLTKSPSRIHHLYAEMIIYLRGAVSGKRLVMKPVEKNSYLYDIYLAIKEKLEGLYDPLMFYFDFLLPGQWGLFPVFNFPTLNPIDTIANGKSFLKDLKSYSNRIYRNDAILNGIEFHEDPVRFLKATFPGRNIYTQLFLTRDILKVQKS